jgi:hypothetical protein
MKFGHRLLAFALFACLTPPALGITRYVNLNSLSPLLPYTNWPAAATNIQDAIDISSPGDLIFVTNGIYNTGSRTAADSTPCRVVINKAVTVQSVNGPEATIVEGYSVPGSFPYSLSSVRCAYLTNNATLLGFTLFNGTVRATSYVNLSDLGGAFTASPSAPLSPIACSLTALPMLVEAPTAEVFSIVSSPTAWPISVAGASIREYSTAVKWSGIPPITTPAASTIARQRTATYSTISACLGAARMAVAYANALSPAITHPRRLTVAATAGASTAWTPKIPSFITTSPTRVATIPSAALSLIAAPPPYRPALEI